MFGPAHLFHPPEKHGARQAACLPLVSITARANRGIAGMCAPLFDHCGALHSPPSSRLCTCRTSAKTENGAGVTSGHWWEGVQMGGMASLCSPSTARAQHLRRHFGPPEDAPFRFTKVRSVRYFLVHLAASHALVDRESRLCHRLEEVMHICTRRAPLQHMVLPPRGY